MSVWVPPVNNYYTVINCNSIVLGKGRGWG